MTSTKHDFKYASGTKMPRRRSVRFFAAAEQVFGKRSLRRVVVKPEADKEEA